MRLIDADALIRDMEENPPSYGDMDRVIAAVNNASTVGGWISVKDGLPEEHADEHPYEFEEYLCATVWNDVRMIGFGTRIGDDKQHFWAGNSIWDDWVTHWMQPPEPPK